VTSCSVDTTLLHRRAALCQAIQTEHGGPYIAEKNPKSSLYCEMSMVPTNLATIEHGISCPLGLFIQYTDSHLTCARLVRQKEGGRRCHLLLNKRWNLHPNFLSNEPGTGCVQWAWEVQNVCCCLNKQKKRQQKHIFTRLKMLLTFPFFVANFQLNVVFFSK
jgi:hypothetical protein